VGEIAPAFAIQEMAFSPDGLRLATTGIDGTLRIWGIKGKE
jgi:WD40 repeat protein